MPHLVTRPDTTIAAHLRGETGDSVLLLQGVGLPACGWDPQVEDLYRDHRCIAIDNRGVGQSGPAPKGLTIDQMVEDAIAVLDDLGVERAHVMGHSMGGILAHQLALDHPHRVASLALLCTFPSGKTAAAPSWTSIWLGMRTNLGPRAWRRRAFLEMVLAPQERTGNLDALARSLEPIFGRDLADAHPMTFAQLGAMRQHDQESRLGELVDIPTLVAWAEHDVIARPRLGRRLADGIGSARAVELSGRAHGAPVTDAPGVNALLREHLASA